MIKPCFLLILSLLLSIITVAQKGKESILLTDMLKIKTVGNITLTKDGSTAAFTVTSIEPNDTSKSDFKFLTQVYSVVTSSDAIPVQLTSSKEGASQPAWSPDGKQLAFIRTTNGKAQIFILSMAGGEPIQLTNQKYAVTTVEWAPNGKQLLFSAAISLQDLLKDSTLNKNGNQPTWNFEKPGFAKNEQFLPGTAIGNPDGSMAEVRAYLQNNLADKKAIVLNKLNFQSESAISADMNFSQYFIIDAEKGADPVLLTKGFFRYNNAQFTPDGKNIILSAAIDSANAPDRSLENEIYIANSSGDSMHMLVGEKGKSFSNAKISSSGKWLAFLHSPVSFVSIPTLAIMPVNGTAKDMISINFDRSPANFCWSKDDRFLYFTATSNGGIVLYKLNIATKKIVALSGFETGVSSFDVANNKIIFSKTQVANPSELYMADMDFKDEKQVSNFNAWVKSKKLSFPEKRSFKNEKGLSVEYWVMKPTGFVAGNKYPLLLEIHGGPSVMWGPGEQSMWHEFQYYCSKGYGIVYGNPRGSNGYGETFVKANINDWGTGPASDVLQSVDKTVAEGWADTSKLLITGGSYAGYLTAWIISHDKRFAAACSQRGVYDLATFFGEGNAWRLVPDYFGGYPWQPEVKKILMRESPITYVDKITTPYIIFHGANDRRTGFVQAEMMYRSLKVLNRPVEFVVHPGATHEITRSGDNRQRMDQLLRTWEFFERWIAK